MRAARGGLAVLRAAGRLLGMLVSPATVAGAAGVFRRRVLLRAAGSSPAVFFAALCLAGAPARSPAREWALHSATAVCEVAAAPAERVVAGCAFYAIWGAPTGASDMALARAPADPAGKRNDEDGGGTDLAPTERKRTARPRGAIRGGRCTVQHAGAYGLRARILRRRRRAGEPTTPGCSGSDLQRWPGSAEGCARAHSRDSRRDGANRPAARCRG